MQPITWGSLAFLVVAGGAVVLYVQRLKREKEALAEKERTRSLGKASLGGPFSLTDHNGERRTDKDFLGQWVLLYFGFTFCPDICPDELDKMTAVVTKIGERSLCGRGLGAVSDRPALCRQHCWLAKRAATCHHSGPQQGLPRCA